MPTAKSQIISQGMEVREEYGANMYFKETHLVTGLVTTHEGALAEALQALGIPVWVSTPGGSPTSNLRLVRRSARIFPDDPTKAYVDCEYIGKHELGTGFVIKAKTGQQVTKSNKDIYGWPVFVGYTYPNPYEKDPVRSGFTDIIGAEFQYQEPTLELETEGIIATSNPTLLAAWWLGRLNASYWQNGPTGWWMVTVADPVPLDITADPPRYQFHFEFTLRIGGWQPEVAYKTPEGDYPNDLVWGFGVKSIYKYPYREYKELFPDV